MCSRSSMFVVSLAAGTLLGLGQPSAAQSRVIVGAPGGERSEGSVQVQARSETVRTTPDGKQIRVVREGGQVRVYLDGKLQVTQEIPQGSQGDEVFQFRMPAEWQNWWNEQNTAGGALGLTGATMPRAFMGVTMAPVAEAVAEQLNIQPGRAVTITSVESGSPAEKAGLRVNDVIVRIADAENPTFDEVRSVLRDKNPGDKVEIEYVRRGERQKVTLELAPNRRRVLGMAQMFADPGEQVGRLNEKVAELSGRLEQLSGELAARPAEASKRAEELSKLTRELSAAASELAQRAAASSLSSLTFQGGGPIVIPPIGNDPPSIIARGMHMGQQGDASGDSPETTRRLDALDRRLARLEELLGKLAEQQKPAGPSSSTTQPAPGGNRPR
ncbi:MAG: PDZ domain-containing protein [Phycisphaerales bacterium]|nr:PDZ domain-containing protein [Phycisphaerales bacterium]